MGNLLRCGIHPAGNGNIGWWAVCWLVLGPPVVLVGRMLAPVSEVGKSDLAAGGCRMQAPAAGAGST